MYYLSTVYGFLPEINVFVFVDPYVHVHGSKIVLNHSDTRLESSQHPVSVVTDILAGLVQLMTGRNSAFNTHQTDW